MLSGVLEYVIYFQPKIRDPDNRNHIAYFMVNERTAVDKVLMFLEVTYHGDAQKAFRLEHIQKPLLW